jgi:hypothetical protein
MSQTNQKNETNDQETLGGGPLRQFAGQTVQPCVRMCVSETERERERERERDRDIERVCACVRLCVCGCVLVCERVYGFG